MTSDQFDKSDDALICLCCRIINTRKKRMIKCFHCGLWGHLSCVGLTGRQADGLCNWYCNPCMAQDLGVPNSLVGNIPGLDSGTPVILAAALADLKSSCRLVKRIPKPVRTQVCLALAEHVETAINNPSHKTWYNFLNFAFRTLKAPNNSKSQKVTLSSANPTSASIQCTRFFYFFRS